MYGDLPYIEHLRDVANVLYRFLDDPDLYLVQAALLHDLIEGTDALVESIEATLVPKFGILYMPSLMGNRKERKEASYRKMATNPDAILIKLADRIANVESCIEQGNMGLLSMYRKEMPAFEENLREHEGRKEMWEHLNELLSN